MTDLVSLNEEDKDPDIELFVKVRLVLCYTKHVSMNYYTFDLSFY